MSESVKVIVRVRPLNEREYGLKCESVIDIETSRGQCAIKSSHDSKAPPKIFFFDGAYDKDSTTEQLYADIVYPLVENVTEGYNGTVFAYGQTGCGKSYTMQGVTQPITQRGVIPRAFDHIFETISVLENTKYLVHASYLEIYNEEIRDLLGKDVKAKLDLKENPDSGVYVNGLSKHKVSNVRECQAVMDRGWKNRSTGATLMNVDSSRSHSIFTIYLEMIDTTDSTGEEHIRAGKLNLVDLAGSERQSKTGSTGDRLKEATKINLSLSALGNVISALVDSKSKHVPYRDSKLTRLLQDSLGGNTKTLMIACLSPADNNYDESLSTLRYANRAKNIQNKPKINEDPKDALLRQYQEEINRLKQMLAGKLPAELTEQDPKNTNKHQSLIIERERQKIREEYEEKLREKELQYSMEAANKEKLSRDMEKLKQYYDSKLLELDIKDMATTDQVLSNKSEISTENLSQLSYSEPSHPMGNESDNDSSAEPDSFIVVDENGNQSLVAHTQRLMSAKYMQRNEPSLLRNSPSSNSNPQQTDPKSDLLEKLKYLRSGIIGGEQAANNLIKDKHNKKKRYAEERRRRLMELNDKMEDEGLMLEVYENIQDELREKMKILNRLKNKNTNLQQEVLDLQQEFEKEKCDYLDVIRRQERDNSLLTAILDRVQPLIKRSCNYSNLDKIKQQAKFNEETGKWILPQPKLDGSSIAQLPDNNDMDSGVVAEMGGCAYGMPQMRDQHDERLFRRLANKPDASQDYFIQQSRRSNHFVNNNNNNNNSNSNYMVNPRSQSPFEDSNPNYPINPANWRTGHRLESISAVPRKSKKKSNKYSDFDADGF